MPQNGSWSGQMRQVLDQLREGAKGYSEKKIEKIDVMQSAGGCLYGLVLAC